MKTDACYLFFLSTDNKKIYECINSVQVVQWIDPYSQWFPDVKKNDENKMLNKAWRKGKGGEIWNES